MTSFVTPIFSWWLIFPIVIITVLLLCVLKWRRNRLAMLAIISLSIMAFVGVTFPVSWKTRIGLSIHWAEHKIDREWNWRVFFLADRGAILFDLTAIDYSNLSEHLGKNLEFTVLHTPNYENYPLFWDRFSITKSDFIEKKLGFQVCWFSVPERQVDTTVVRKYSITVPQWFVFLLCVPFPLVWFGSFRRRRYRLNHNLCLKCGYDLRATTDKCPECGTALDAPRTVTATKHR